MKYIVTGQRGQYAEREVWVIAAYDNKKAAEDHASAAKVIADKWIKLMAVPETQDPRLLNQYLGISKKNTSKEKMEEIRNKFIAERNKAMTEWNGRLPICGMWHPVALASFSVVEVPEFDEMQEEIRQLVAETI